MGQCCALEAVPRSTRRAESGRSPLVRCINACKDEADVETNRFLSRLAE